MLTFVLTIIGAVTIFVIGQFLLKLFIEPINELLRIRGEIEDALIYYADVYCNPGVCNENENRKAQANLRQEASLLIAKANVIKWYSLFEKLKIIPSKKEEVIKAGKILIGLSNSIFKGTSEDNMRRRDEIRKALKLEMID